MFTVVGPQAGEAGSKNGSVVDQGGIVCGRKITHSGSVREFGYSVEWRRYWDFPEDWSQNFNFNENYVMRG